MSKELRKNKRKYNLCKNKTHTIERSLSSEEIEEIKEWCEENLTGCCTWIENSLYFSKHTMGFHDQYDLVAFILRWG